MFSKLCLLALIAPLTVSGLQLQIPENPTTDGQITIHWTNEQGDPDTWSFELVNVAFNNAFAIANNVNPSASSLTLTLPSVPVGDGYTLEAVNIGNINDVFAQTGTFSIGPTATGSTTTGSNTASSTTLSQSSASASKNGTVTGSSRSITSASSATGFSSLIVTSNTAAVSTGTTPTTSGTSGAAITPSSAALSSRVALAGSAGGFAAVLLSAVAGAAMIAL